MLLPLLLGCEVEVRGQVVDPSGAPVGGAVLSADGGCTAVTAEDGAFRTRCARADYHFVVSHPTHAAGTLHVDASGTLPPEAARATLTPWPTEPGLYLEPAYTPIPAVGLVRTATKTEQRFCLPEGATLVETSTNPTIFDLHRTDWRVYPLDAEGCALRLDLPSGSRFWSPTGTHVPPTDTQELAPGRLRVRYTLPAGRYVATPWLDSFFVPEDPEKDTWAAWGFVVK